MTTKLTIALTSILALAACGDGDLGRGSGSADDIQILTGSRPLLETAADQSARVAGMISRADSLILSTTYIDTSDPVVPRVQIRAACSGPRCSVRAPAIGYYDTISISDLEIVSGSRDFAHSKHGITLFGGRTVGENYGARTFGSWMHHSTFQVESASAFVDGTTLQTLGGSTGGDLTGYSPSTSATWRGVMVGTPISGADRGNFLQGDAFLSYGSGASGFAEIDAAFTNIKNIDRNRDHSVASIRFDDVPAHTDGTFEAGITGNRIQGGFYGPGYAETAGIFEQRGIVGSFGAKR